MLVTHGMFALKPFRINQLSTCFLFVLLSFSFLGSANANNQPPAPVAIDNVQLRQLAQLAEYVGVDYSAAIADGKIINADEYQEMIEFSGLIIEKVASNTLLPAAHNQALIKLNKQAKQLSSAITQKVSVAEVRQISADLRATLLSLMPSAPLPKRLLNEKSTQVLFQQHCSQCHGTLGQGDGALAAQLSPEPTDFTEKDRAENRSLLGLYDAITNGLDDTAMPAFTQLKEQQRWSLAFYAGSLAFQDAKNAEHSKTLPSEVDLQQWINLSPAQLNKQNNHFFSAKIESFRASPTQLFDQKNSPLSVTKKQLENAFLAYKNQQYKQAKTLAVSAYLDGFELIENNLDARDKVLRKSIEVNLINLRNTLSKADQQVVLTEQLTLIYRQLAQADQLMSGSALSNEALFSASLVILLREGLEALLVVIALMTVLVRTNRKDALKYIHIGWVAALVAGGGTWILAQTLISISGASRELMEGFAALIAAIMLLYVGIWMHSKTNADQWQAYIQKHINSQLKSGTLWGLAALSFIAVYREVFETVLFYQSLLTQAESSQYSVVIAGFAVGSIILAVVAWGILKYSIKLPIARFFSATTYLLLALSFILMGKAVSALQEAAYVGISPLPFNFSFEWLGIGSTWQGGLAQLAVILFFITYKTLSATSKK